MPRKILLGVGATLGLLLAALLALPLLFTDEIEARVRAEIEAASRVRVSWSDVGLGFFRDFPHPTFTLSELTVLGTGSYDGDTLAAVDAFRLTLDGPSVLRAVRGSGPLVVRSVRLAEPRLRLRVDEEGVASWDVVAERDDTTGPQASGPGGVAVSLRSFELTDGDIRVEDARSGLLASVQGLRHSLRGDFSRESLVARATTHADAVTFHFGGVPYLAGVSLDFDGDFEVDMGRPQVRFTDNELRLNDLVVRFGGAVARQDEALELDLAFEAPSTEFAQVLSLVPAVYGQDFASLETSGTFALDGSARGTYREGAFPSFSLSLSIADGSFRYPDLPLPARAIAADLSVTNPGGTLDATVVDLSRFHVEIGEETLDAALTLRTPISDPEAEARVLGTLDLADVARTVKLADGPDLRGVVVADASVRARRSDVDSTRYDRIAAEGTVSMRDVTLRGESLRQPVHVRQASLSLTPQSAELESFDATLGSSDVHASGRLDDLLGFALGSRPLTGTASFTSERLVLDEWRSGGGLQTIAVPDRLDLTLDGSIDTLVFDGLEMRDAKGRAIVRDERLTLEGFSLRTLGGRVAMDGYYETLEPERPTFSFQLGLDSLDVAGTAEAFLAVRALAPVARYARGTFSSTLGLSGAVGESMTPVLEALDGSGSLATSPMQIEGFPLLQRLGESLELQRLSNPTVDALRSSIRIQGGRLVVDPFPVTVGGLAMTVSGSNGIDQSVDYTLGIEVPRTGFAESALSRLASAAGPLGAGLAAMDPIPVSARVTGSVTQPRVELGLRETAGSLRGAATQAVTDAVGQRVDDAQQRLDAAEEEARARARARADSIVAEAERAAEAIRAEAARAAAEVRAEGDRAADALMARATNPLARAAAQPAADRLRQEADARAAALEREADERAIALVTEARERADAIVRASGGG